MKVDEFEEIINYKFQNKSLIDLALTHSSFKNKKKTNYERLEFLGDRVLSLVISEYLFVKYSNENEGALSKRLSNLVSKQTLLEVANEISIKEMLKIDIFEKKKHKIKKKYINFKRCLRSANRGNIFGFRSRKCKKIYF